jgi:hypothetical protein
MYHEECVQREQFARNPGASNRDWVDFNDLPETTRKALRERGGYKRPSFDDDLIDPAPQPCPIKYTESVP